MRFSIWCFVFLLLSGSIATAANLTGVWARSDGSGEVTVSQNGQQISAVWSNPSAGTAQDYGFKAGDQYFYGTLYGLTLIGKMTTHFPIKYKTLCPSQWEASVDMVLILSSDANTLNGLIQNNIINDNCTTTAGEWADQTLTRKEQCVAVNDNLGIAITCAEYNGAKYKFNLNYTSGILWKGDVSTFGNSTGGTCLSVGNDLALKIPCAGFKTNTFSFTLNFFQNKEDPSGVYWQMDVNSLVQK